MQRLILKSTLASAKAFMFASCSFMIFACVASCSLSALAALFAADNIKGNFKNLTEKELLEICVRGCTLPREGPGTENRKSFKKFETHSGPPDFRFIMNLRQAYFTIAMTSPARICYYKSKKT